MPYPTRLLIILFLTIPATLIGQVQWGSISTDSLAGLVTEEKDTSQIRLYRELAFRHLSQGTPEDVPKLARKGLKLSEELGYYIHIPNLTRRIGQYHLSVSKNNDSAFHYFYQAIDTAKALGMPKHQQFAYSTAFWGFLELDSSHSALAILDQAGELAFEMTDTAKLVDIYQLRATVYYDLNESRASIVWIKKAIELAERATNPNTKAAAYISIESFYSYKEDFPKAITYDLKAINEFLIQGDSSRLADLYINISIYYDELGNYPKALEYILLNMGLKEQDGPTSELANTYNSVGWEYKQLQEWEKALHYYLKSKNLFKSHFPHDLNLAYPLGNLGIVYTRLQQFDSAIVFSERAKDLFDQMGYPSGVAEAEVNIGNALFGKGNYQGALQHLNEGQHIAREADDLYELRNAYMGLYNVYRAMKNENKALTSLEHYIQVTDSLYNVQRISEAQEIEANMEQERDEAMIDALKTQSLLDEATLSQQRTINIALIIIVGIVCFSMVLVYRNWKSKRKAYAKLHESHTILNASKEKIETQHKEIEHQNVLLAEQHKDILDSINFASRIQQALLKPEVHVTDALPPHFIFYKPRDIVSGDFYWAVQQHDFLYLAAVDCTGHGVPGALMSMLGIAYLNEIVALKPDIEPDQILEGLRTRVIKELGQEEQRETNYREGMDCALVRLNLKSNQLLFAGANNPLWLVREGDIHVYRGSKQGISYSEHMSPFTQKEIELREKDSFYIFSDGYADQFGGEQGKKFKYSKLKQLLLDIEPLPMSQQRQKLEREFSAWQGDMAQVDDVCVIGMKV